MSMLGCMVPGEREKNWDVVRVGLFKLDDLWMDSGCEIIFWGLWTWGSLKKLLMDKIQLTTKDDDYPIIFRVLTISGGDRRISEPSTGYRSFHGIPWLDPMNSVEITGQMRLKYRNNATVVVQGWCLTLVGCVFFSLRSNLQEVIVSILDLCKLLHASCHIKVFFSGWVVLRCRKPICFSSFFIC